MSLDAVTGVARICGCRLRASEFWPISCAYLLLKSLLRASVSMALLAARICIPKHPCVHPFQKWPLRSSVFRIINNQHLDLNIWNFGFYYWVFRVPLSNPCLWGVIQSTKNISHATRTVTVVHVILCCKTPVVKRKDSDVRIQMMGFSESEYACTQGSFLKQMHARVVVGTDVHNQKVNFYQCKQ